MSDLRSGSLPYSTRGAWAVLGISVVLAGIAGIYALVPVPGPVPGLSDYPNMTGFASVLIDSALVISAFLLNVAMARLSREPVATTVGVALTAIVAGAALFAVTLYQSVPVRLSSGGVVDFQPYPQTILPVLWGVCALALTPVGWILARRSRAGLQLDPGPNGAVFEPR